MRIVFAFFLLVSSICAQEGKQADFLRISRDKDGEVRFLETAIVRYSNGTATVDLVGAVHIGEKGYYKRLNNFFSKCDTVLYELVAEPENQIPTPNAERSGNPISFMQSMMKSVLGLEGQMDHIDYTQAHFVHADLTPTEMKEKMTSRGDTPLTLALTAIAEMMREQNKKGDLENLSDGLDLITLLQDPDGVAIKRLMAKQMETSELNSGPLGGRIGQILVQDRNEECIKVLLGQLEVRKDKHYAIFYGAAHLPDLHVRMKEIGFKPIETKWLKAWDLRTSDQKYNELD